MNDQTKGQVIVQLRRKNQFLERKLQHANEVIDQLKAALQEKTRRIKQKFDPEKLLKTAQREILPVALDLIERRGEPVSGDDIEERVNAINMQKGIPPKAVGSVKRACRLLSTKKGGNLLIRVGANRYAVSSIIQNTEEAGAS